jgi:hypothetical protein
LAKIISLKIEIPADDDVRVDEVKAQVKAHIIKLGRVDSPPGDGQGTMLDRSTFYGASSVKYWTAPDRKKAVRGVAQ